MLMKGREEIKVYVWRIRGKLSYGMSCDSPFRTRER